MATKVYDYIRSVPGGEHTATPEMPDFHERQEAEAHAFVNQIHRTLGWQPKDTFLEVASADYLGMPNESGSYKTILVMGDDTYQAFVAPEVFKFVQAVGKISNWDDESIKELAEKGFLPTDQIMVDSTSIEMDEDHRFDPLASHGMGLGFRSGGQCF